MKGLRNLGDTCYANVVIQCLLHVPQITNYFLFVPFRDDMNKKRQNASALCEQFASLVHTYWSTPDEVDPAPLLSAVAKCFRSFNVHAQHDAHDFFYKMVQTLHEAQSKTKEFNAVAMDHVNVDAWRRQNDKNYSFFTEVFQFQIERSFICDGTVDVQYEHCWDLSLLIDTVSSVPAAIAKYLEDDEIQGYKRGQVTQPAKCVRKFTYTPIILVIHLARFNNHNRKTDKFIDYAIDLALDGSASYKLFGVIMHHSDDTTHGHYTCMCEVRGHWYKMNDDAVSRIEDINTIIQRDAYILFYKRVM